MKAGEQTAVHRMKRCVSDQSLRYVEIVSIYLNVKGTLESLV